MVSPFDPPASTRNHQRTTRGKGRTINHPDPDTDLDMHLALQGLIQAAEAAGNFLPGGLPEGLALHNALEQARKYA